MQKEKTGKSRPFSIYLLKEGFDATNSLNTDHKLEENEDNNTSDGAHLFILDQAPTPPWWKNYFGITKDLHQSLKGALLFIPVNDKCFAICLGNVYHHLCDTAYEYDFGLKVTLNSLDPNKIKGTDIFEPSAAIRQRIQIPIAADLTFFDFDINSNVIKSLTGKVKEEYLDIFSYATGNSSLKIKSKHSVDKLYELCSKLLELYNDKSYETTFPDINNVQPQKDPMVINRLNGLLLNALKGKDSNLSLSVPDIINDSVGVYCVFKGAGKSLLYEDVDIENYYSYLEYNDVDTGEMADFPGHYLAFEDENGNIKERHDISKCLIYDTELEGKKYSIIDGNWYHIKDDYLSTLISDLDEHFKEIDLPDFNHSCEGSYNSALPKASFVCLDKTNVASKGNIEPCDACSLEDDKVAMYHIKRSTRSSNLSHLFNQGYVAVTYLMSDPKAKSKLISIINDKKDSSFVYNLNAPVNNDDFKLVFGIISSKNKSKKSENLPLFSKIALQRIIKTLKLMKIPVECSFINDAKTKQEGKEKPRKKKIKNDVLSSINEDDLEF